MAAAREYVQRVCAAVRSSAALAALGGDVPELLAAQLRAHQILQRYSRDDTCGAGRRRQQWRGNITMTWLWCQNILQNSISLTGNNLYLHLQLKYLCLWR